MVSHTPRRVHASASKLSWPFSVALITRSRGQPARNLSSTVSAMQAISPSAVAASSATRAPGQIPSPADGTRGSAKRAR